MIYWLNGILENLLFDGFVFEDDDEGQISDVFYPENIRTVKRNWTAPKLADRWSPPAVFGNVHVWNDYPCFDRNIPVFSRRAFEILEPLIADCGEPLPLPVSAGDFLIFNVTRVVDAINREKSEFEWTGGKEGPSDLGMPMSIERYEFFATELSDVPMFKVPEDPTCIFVNQAFFDRVEKHKLQGFHLVKVWPNDDGKTWREREDELCDKEVKIKSLKKPIV